MADTDLTYAFYDRLAGDAVIGALLSRYRGYPAIFTSERVPGDADYPYIVTPGFAQPDPFTSEAQRPSRYIRDIQVFDDWRQTPERVEMLTARVIERFTWAGIAETNFEDLLAQATRGVEGDHLDVQERRVRVFLFTEESDLADLQDIGFVDYEEPTAVSTTVFTTAKTFLTGSLYVEVNGYPQKPDTDYTVNATNTGFTLAVAPRTGAEIVVRYRYSREGDS